MLRYTEEEIAQKLESTANVTKADGQDRECIGFVLSHVEKVLRADNPPKEVMNLCMAAIRAAEAAAEPWQQSFAHDLGAAYCRELYRRSEEVKRLEAEVAHSGADAFLRNRGYGDLARKH